MRATGIKTRWVNSDRQLADVLTKPTAPSASIHRLQQTGRWKIVWDADFTSAKNIRKEKRDNHFKGKQTKGNQVKGKTTQSKYVAFDPQTDQADLVNHLVDMERQSNPTYGLSPLAEIPEEEVIEPVIDPGDIPISSSESDVDSDLDGDLAVAAASYLSHEPFESGDQEDCMVVRVPQEWDSRAEELEEQWLNAVRERFPRDKEKRERLILAFQIEQAALRCATKEANKKVEEQKDRRTKRKLKDREPGLPPDVDVTKAYFKRAVHPSLI